MTKSEFGARCSNLFDTYEQWFSADRKNSGAYAVDFMPGWLPLLEKLLSEIADCLSQQDAARFNITQIKEKFGSLRVYYSGQGLRVDFQSEDGICSIRGANPNSELTQIDDLIEQAEKNSGQTCMYCGDEGTLRTDEWLVVLCDHHYSLDCEGKTLSNDFELMTTPARRH